LEWRLLSNQKEELDTSKKKVKGTFLVRLNTGEKVSIDKAPFTITRVGDDGNVLHTRVYTKQKGGLMIKTNEGEKLSARGNSIVDFINFVKTKNANLLTVPCPGWPYEHIFQEKPPQRSAYDEASDGEVDE